MCTNRLRITLKPDLKNEIVSIADHRLSIMEQNKIQNHESNKGLSKSLDRALRQVKEGKVRLMPR